MFGMMSMNETLLFYLYGCKQTLTEGKFVSLQILNIVDHKVV